MKYNIGDLFVCKMPYKGQSTIGIIMEYNDEYDIYTIEWMHGKKRWDQNLYGSDIDIDISVNQKYHYHPVK
jgi:hypothetical protein